MSENSSFFEEQKEQSLVKSTIVAKYFKAWSTIITSVQNRHQSHDKKIAYIDLFAGPGRYKDGSQSTPVKILTTAIENRDLRERLVTIFNDKDEENIKSLKETIRNIKKIETLKYYPEVHNLEVGDNIVKQFESKQLVPTLFFVDPWGYKGLSLRLINSVLKDWGCDAIFFFNYNRISMGIPNASVREHMQALFGEEQIPMLQEKLDSCKNSSEREVVIIEELCQSLKRYGSRYVLPFRFKNEKGRRTSHHLIFVSKSFRGYEIMKDIMARESTSDTQGVPSFEYNPADFLPRQALLFQLNRPLNELKDSLLNVFKGKTLTMKEIYEKHNIDTPYIKKNYKDILMELYSEGVIKAISTTGKPPRKGTFGDDTKATFPS